MTCRRALLTIAFLALAGAAMGNTYTVTSIADSGAGSLRQAIIDANASLGLDTIAFNIVGSGVHTITPATPLPPITDAVTVDGYTQPGSSPNTNAVGLGLNTVLMIEIAGTTAAGNGLEARADGVTFRGLAVNRFSQDQVGGSPSFDHASLVVEGCFIGASPDGLQGYSGGNGVSNSDLGARIGGLTPAQRNLISLAAISNSVSMSYGGVIQGNLIGTDITGARKMPVPVTAFSDIGISLSGASPITVGGTDPNAGNVIAGMDIGIGLGTAVATIQGNFIGVDAAQAGVISSGTYGISHPSPVGGTIGGAGPGEGNVIGGFDYGIFLDSAAAPLYGNFIGTDTSATKNFGNRIMGIFLSTHSQVVGSVGAGEGNVIAFNGWVGILVTDFAQMNPIRGNRIFSNGIGGVGANGVGLAIDLGNSSTPSGQNPNDLGDADGAGNQFGNDFQNYPLITSAVPEGGGTRVIGTLNSLASTVFNLDFYSNPACRGRPRALLQAETFIGSTQVTTDGSGNASFNVFLPTPIAAGAPVTAAATGPEEHTSELWQEIIFRVTRGVGGPGDTFEQSIRGHLFEPGATMTIGGNPIAVTENSTFERSFVGPSLTPGNVYDIVLTNPSGLSGTLRNGYVSRFSDVVALSLFDSVISKLVAAGVTAGCGGGNYCPAATVTRQQMAVFVLKAKHGICYTPPPCSGVFPDVPCSSNFAPWIEQFAAEGITGGCGGGNFCPLANVRRDQMAVFMLKGKYGSNFTPPPCTGAFDDVPCPSTFADWIEQLAAEGVTGGCQVNPPLYCPTISVNRGQMAAFLVKAFSLP
ncbi:MAG: S-layer homology domain-containing protein [Thermoanaerobaculia bacterium]